ncbi:MAG: hypothetical protein R3F39_09250 [Myxococcota bacterium]
MGERPVGVGFVGEGAADLGRGCHDAAVLGAAGARVQGRGGGQRGGEARRFVSPRLTIWNRGGAAAQEVLGAAVLVEAANQVGDGALHLVGGDGGGVDQQIVGEDLDDAAGGLGHALEHLEADVVLGAVERAQDEAVGEVEDVVRCDAEVQGGGVFGLGAQGDHALEVGVDQGLRGEGRLGPAVEGGVDLLHGEVGAFDEAQPRGGAAAGDSRVGPRQKRLLHCERVWEIGLEHDAGGGAQELGGVQDAPKERHGEVEVAVFLHVQVDQRRVRAGLGGADEAGQALGQQREGLVEGEQLDL